MTKTSSNSILSRMGYAICSESRGIYHLRRIAGAGEPIDSVALFYCPGPVDQVDRVKFIEFDVSGVPNKEIMISKIVQHWGLLDARRIEESGVNSYTIPRADFGVVIEGDLTFKRPDDIDRLRHAARMATGEIVCFN